MFERHRASVEALQKIATCVEELSAQLLAGRGGRENSEYMERLEGLELSRAKWEAEMEAALLRADGRYKAAAAAESRERTVRKAYEKIAAQVDGPGVEDGQVSEEEYDNAWFNHLQSGNAEGSPTDGMLDVPMGVEANAKTRALRAKFS